MSPIVNGYAPTLIPIRDLRPNPLNPRGAVDDAGLEELIASIVSQGILQPLLVTPDGLVVAGHRRLAAATRAGLAEVPVLIKQLTPGEQLEIMLVENIQREDLTVLQEARAYERLISMGMRQSEVARKVGVPHVRISDRLALLQLDADVQRMIDQGELPLTLVRPLVSVRDVAKQRRLALIAARRRLSAARLADIIREEQATLGAPPKTFAGPDALPTPKPGMRRIEAVEWLQGHLHTGLMLGDVLHALESVCCACGMGSLEDVCRECPLPQLVEQLRERVSYA